MHYYMTRTTPISQIMTKKLETIGTASSAQEGSKEDEGQERKFTTSDR